AAETSRGIIYVNGTARFAFDRMARALAKAQAAHLIGDCILGSAFSFHVEIRRGPRGFVRGEERALLASIEGQRASPGTKLSLPPESRLWGKPTVISNAETLAALPPLIAWGRAGTPGRAWPDAPCREAALKTRTGWSTHARALRFKGTAAIDGRAVVRRQRAPP